MPLHAILAGLTRRLDRAGLLGAPERQVLLGLKPQRRQVPARADIRGTRDHDGAHLIVSGVACRYEMLPDGTRCIIALYFPGEFCGVPLLVPRTVTSTVGALSACVVADVPLGTLETLVRAYPRIGLALWWLSVVELSIAQEWLVNAGRDAERRIAHAICEILARQRASGCDEHEVFSNGIRQVTLADITAVSTVHVNRVLHALQEGHLIKLAKGVVTVPDFARLAAFAGFHPGYLHLSDGATAAPSEAGAPGVSVFGERPDARGFAAVRRGPMRG